MSEEVAEDGVAFFNVACQHGLEGIVSKRVDRPYRSGKSGEWLKTKCVETDSFVIVGYHERFITNAQDMADKPYGVALAQSLCRVFPCQG